MRITISKQLASFNCVIPSGHTNFCRYAAYSLNTHSFYFLKKIYNSCSDWIYFEFIKSDCDKQLELLATNILAELRFPLPAAHNIIMFLSLEYFQDLLSFEQVEQFFEMQKHSF